jgi:anti-sigma regulatory factor (Ser/Thr protein kinase)
VPLLGAFVVVGAGGVATSPALVVAVVPPPPPPPLAVPEPAFLPVPLVRRTAEMLLRRVLKALVPAATSSVGTSSSRVVVVDETLRRWDCGEQLDVVTLLVSEVVTNAIVHAGTDVEVSVELKPDAVRIEVSDEAVGLPAPRDATDEETSGRGLALVEALASEWGVDSRPEGKVVWFEVPRLDGPAAAEA